MVIWNQPAIYPPCQRIRTALNVYGENVCKIIPIDRPAFGHVVAVCVGASMAGSIHTTVAEGQVVKRGQEFGYFAFGMYPQIKSLISTSDTLLCSGGSTVVLLF